MPVLTSQLDCVPILASLVRHVEALILRPSQILLRSFCSLRPQRLAVRLVRTRLGASVTDHRAHPNQRRPRRLCLRSKNRSLNRHQVVPICHMLHMPVISLEPPRHILCKRELRRPIQRDQVVVIQHNQLAQTQCARKRSRLMRDAFHQVAVSAQYIRVVVDDVVRIAVINRRQMFFGSRNSHRHAESLTKRTRCHLNPRRVATLWMARRMGAILPELLELRHRQIVARQVQRTIQHRRRMPIRQHKAVPIDPLRVARIVFHQLMKQQIHNRRAAQRSARVPRLGLLDLIDGQKAEGINGYLIYLVLLRILRIAHTFSLSLESCGASRLCILKFVWSTSTVY